MSSHAKIPAAFNTCVLGDCVISSQTNQKCKYTKMISAVCLSTLILIHDKVWTRCTLGIEHLWPCDALFIRFLTNSTTLSGLHATVDPGQLVLYHLLRYSLETVSNEEDEEGEDRRIDAAVENDPRMGNTEGIKWGEGDMMEDEFTELSRECRASS
jgi:hypothetical protein